MDFALGRMTSIADRDRRHGVLSIADKCQQRKRRIGLRHQALAHCDQWCERFFPLFMASGYSSWATRRGTLSVAQGGLVQSTIATIGNRNEARVCSGLWNNRRVGILLEIVQELMLESRRGSLSIEAGGRANNLKSHIGHDYVPTAGLVTGSDSLLRRLRFECRHDVRQQWRNVHRRRRQSFKPSGIIGHLGGSTGRVTVTGSNRRTNTTDLEVSFRDWN